MSYIVASNVMKMKKEGNTKATTPYKPKQSVPKVQEPAPVYKPVKALPAVKDFTYAEFKKIAGSTLLHRQNGPPCCM